MSKYDELLARSKFFKNSENSFGTYQANEILKSTEDNSFFEAGHKFTLNDNVEIKSTDELKQILEKEIISIINDVQLKKSFEQVKYEASGKTDWNDQQSKKQLLELCHKAHCK